MYKPLSAFAPKSALKRITRTLIMSSAIVLLAFSPSTTAFGSVGNQILSLSEQDLLLPGDESIDLHGTDSHDDGLETGEDDTDETELPEISDDPDEAVDLPDEVVDDGPGSADQGDEPLQKDAIENEVSIDDAPSVSKFGSAGTCTPGAVYGISRSGKFFHLFNGSIEELQSAESLYADWVAPEYSSNVVQKNGVNGLAVAPDGTMYAHARTYAYDSGYPETQWWPRITMMTKKPGQSWQWLYGPQKTYALENDEVPIAGAISPTTGNYLFGGFEGSPVGGRAVFTIREVDLVSHKAKLVGKVDVGSWNKDKHPTINGDIAFDASGNLYIVRHTEDGQSGSRQGPLTITTVKAGSMIGATGGTLRGTTTKGKNFTGPVAGIATAHDGYVYISGATDIRRVHPTTLEVTYGYSVGFVTHQDAITDLASCAITSTLRLEKNLKSRYAGGDQFRLTVSDSNNEEIARATTSGNTLGLQNETVGPLLVAAGSEYNISELGTNGASTSNYKSNYSCTDQSGKVLTSGAGAKAKLVIPAESTASEITCTFTNEAQKPAMDPGVCVPDGSVYGVSDRGQIVHIPPTGNPDVDAGAQALVGAMPNEAWSFNGHWHSKGGVNGLAVAEDGTMYAYLRYQRAPSGESYSSYVAFLVKSPGKAWEWVDGRAPFGPGIPFNHNPHEARVNTVVGAVDPISNNFYYGWYLAQNGQTVLELWEFNTSTHKTRELGKLVTGATSAEHSVANGDIAFDELGNLYALRHLTKGGVSDGKGPLTLTTVTRDNFANAQTQPGITMPGTITKAKQGEYQGGAVNGVAVRPNGTLAISTQDNVYAIDPTTAAIIGSPLAKKPFPSGAGGISDLTSCAKTMTLVVQKQVNGRVLPGDQFTLKVANSNDEIARATTNGTADGIQSQQIGPVLIRAGQTYTFSEEGANATDLQNYNSHYKCEDSDGSMLASGNGASGELQIPSNALGQAYTCIITNTPKKPALSLTKVDADDQELKLSGAKFQLWRDSDGDNLFDPNKDEAVSEPIVTQSGGQASWTTGLVPGTYFVEEVSPPLGYLLPELRVHTVKLLAQDVDLVVKNTRIKGTLTWMKTDNTDASLTGSEWKLGGPSLNGQNEIVILDCVANAPTDCTGPDTDPRPGHFLVRDLAWGDYVLTETKAPAGFILDDTEHNFKIGPDAPAELDIDFGGIVNLQQAALVIPLTGGIGTVWFLGFGALLTLITVGAMIRRGRAA